MCWKSVITLYVIANETDKKIRIKNFLIRITFISIRILVELNGQETKRNRKQNQTQNTEKSRYCQGGQKAGELANQIAEKINPL